MKKAPIYILVALVLVVVGWNVYYYFVATGGSGGPKVEVSMSKSDASVGDPVLSFQTSSTSVQVGQQFTVNINIDTKSRTLSATELHISFPSATLQGLSVVRGPFLHNELVAGSISGGSASITIGSRPESPQKGSGTLAVLTFKALSISGSPAQVAFTSNTKVAVIGEEGNTVDSMNPISITVSVVPTPTPTPTPTVSFSVSPDKITKTYESATLSWSTTNATNLSIDNGIGVVANPSGTKVINPSNNVTYTLTAINGNNTVSRPVVVNVFQPGDLDKDRQVNIFDYNTLLTDFGKNGLRVADINKDSVVNIFDYNILVTNFGR